jgi:hypothetical protein
MMIEVDMEVRMRYILTGLLILTAAVALFAAGCERVAQAPDEQRPGDKDPCFYREDVAEVVVTGERPGWLMPEVVVSASLLPEVVVHASRVPAPVTLSALPPSDSVN